MRIARSLVLVFLAQLCIFEPGHTKSHNVPTEVLWDTWGVPHIFAHDDRSAFLAFGWAEMHNDGNTLLRLYARARGRGAEFFGATELNSDRTVRTMGIPSLAYQWYNAQTSEFRSYLDAFAAGINLYGRHHPEDLDPAARQVLPVNGVDVMAHAMRMLWIFQGGISGCGREIRSSYELGSNGWAIGAADSADGHAMLLANPHLPWNGEMMFFEAQITTPDYQVYGATLIGFPVLAIAFNQYLGWTHTVNMIDPCDTYVLTSDGDGYRLDGQHRAFQIRTETLKIRQTSGQMASQEIEIRRATQGPVIELHGKVMAVRDAGLQAGSFAGVLHQWWTMGRAHNFDEFQAALRQMQLPMFNTVYADRDGNDFLFYAGLVPRRRQGDFRFWSAPVPGNDSLFVWTDMLSYETLPKSLNPPAGWLQNSNSAPWYMTLPLLDPDKFPPYIAPPIADPAGWPNFREQRGIRMLTQVHKLSYTQLVADKYSTRSELADRVVDELVASVTDNDSDLAKDARNTLRNWDRNTDATSRGGVLFAAWARRAFSNGVPFSVPFDPARLLDTPCKLKDPATAVHQLEIAASEVKAHYGSLDVPWGDVYRLRRGKYDLPGNGGPGDLGIFRVIEYAPDGDGRFESVAGDSFIAIIEFSNPIKANVLLTYGNSSDPNSPHFGDQLKLAADKQLRRAWLDRSDIRAHMAEDSILLPDGSERQLQR